MPNGHDIEPALCPSILFSDLTVREFGTDKISLIGTFSQFNAPRFPFIAPPFHVTLLLTNIRGPIDQLPVTVRIEAEGSGHVIVSTSGSIPIPPTHGLADIAQVVLGLPPTQYQIPGRYEVHVLVRNESIGQRPIFVRPITSATTTETTPTTNALTSLNLIADVTAWTEFQPPASGEYSRGPATSGFFAEASEIPADFLEALDDFSHGRVVSDEIALNQPPPNA